MGGNHPPFGAEGLVCSIAERTDRRPQYLWCANGGTMPWPGYSPVPGVPVELGGVHGTLRTLLERNSPEKPRYRLGTATAAKSVTIEQ